MITQDRVKIEREVVRMMASSEIAFWRFDWYEMQFRFIPVYGRYYERVLIEGDTVDEIVEAIRLDVNQILQDMIDTLEASKLDYKYGPGAKTI